MNSKDDTAFRWTLASGFLKEAEEDFGLKRWRSCVDNAQLALENAAKAFITRYEPPEKTHDPGRHIRRLMEEQKIPVPAHASAARLIELCKQLGFEEHILSDYGDEKSHKSPWELFDEDAASQALSVAREGISILKELLHG